MITENKLLMSRAREALKGKWDIAVLAFFIYFLLTGAVSSIPNPPVAFSVVALLIGGPLALGAAIVSLALSRGKEVKLALLFEGFNTFTNALVAYLLVVLFVLLWTLLLIVPGIIAALSYSLTFYILADDPSVEAMDAINRSKKMMYGYKWKLFCLGLRFTGWFLLCLLTCGIGFLWLTPYMHVSFAKFYEDVKANGNPGGGPR